VQSLRRCRVSNLFDAKKKAVVTVSGASEAKKKHKSLNWMTIELVDGEYNVLIQRIDNGTLVVSKTIPAIDINDAELMFEQYANKYIFDRQELKDE